MHNAVRYTSETQADYNHRRIDQIFLGG